MLISKTGRSVYNITKITNVTSTTNIFNWNMRIDGQYTKIKNGYKILIAAMDHRDCLGTQGGFTIINTSNTKILNESTMVYHKENILIINIILILYIISNSYSEIILQWLLLAGVVICIVLGFISIMTIYNKNGYQLVLPIGR